MDPVVDVRYHTHTYTHKERTSKSCFKLINDPERRAHKHGNWHRGRWKDLRLDDGDDDDDD